MGDFHLVCVHPFDKYTKGQMITDPDEVDKLMPDRDHHFVRIAIPAGFAEPELVSPSVSVPVKKDK